VLVELCLEIERELDKHLLDDRLVALAVRRHGVVTRAQLTRLGFGPGAIQTRLRSRRLHRVHRGVYAVGHPALTPHGRLLAAVVSYGNQAVLSHQSAAVLWELRKARGPRIDVTVPGGGGRARRQAIIVHRSPLTPDDVTVREAIPVTTPARTIVDLADYLPRRRLERTIDEAAHLRLDLRGLRAIPGRRGAGLLRRVLADHDAGSTRTRSDLEELMLALCQGEGLPQPEVNRKIEGYEADFSWPAAHLIVETDAWSSHGTRGAFESDRVRDAEHTAAGWRVVRITKRRLEREPEAVAGQLRRLLGA
jgi:very-short-patch-repair endonuclease